MQSSEVIMSTILIATTITLLLAAFIIYILFRYNKNQGIQTTIFENELLTSQLEVQEQTFRHISEELHDNVSQILTLAKLNLVTSDIPLSYPEVQSKINESIDLLGYGLDEIRSFSRSLSPDYIAEKGLLEMVKEFIDHIQKAWPFLITLNVTGEIHYLEDRKEMILFRIIQETFNNIVKHSKAKNIGISFLYSKHELQVIIEDDGVGFNVGQTLEQCYANGSSGLKNISKRAKLLNAKFEINSINQKGTTLCIITPC